MTLLLWIWNSFCLKCMFVKQIFRTAIVARNVEVDVDSLDHMFYKLDNITTISGLDSWDTRNVVDMKFLFGECKNLEVVSGIESIDVLSISLTNIHLKHIRGLQKQLV